MAVIGAGPYGLVAAAHLRHAGVETHVFGDPMGFWRDQMPRGMLLRSPRRATHLSDPHRALTLDEWARERGAPLVDPTPLSDFLAYGEWFARRAVPDVDRRHVRRVEVASTRFRLSLDDGSEVDAGRVVVAAGLFPFPHRPEIFAELGTSLVSHACDHAELGTFAGQRVLVVGGGQSALESAALLHEEGAEVEVAVRAGGIFWLPDKDGGTRLHDRAYPPTGVGGIRTGWVAAVPDVFRRLPQRQRPSIFAGCLRPAGAHWLRPRLANVRLTIGREVTAAHGRGGSAALTLSDGSSRTVDHVLLATGYRIDIARYPFLPAELLAKVRLDRGRPHLGVGLESTLAGLHFLGAPAEGSFGPIMRFVTGSSYAAPALTSRVVGRRGPLVNFAFG